MLSGSRIPGLQSLVAGLKTVQCTDRMLLKHCMSSANKKFYGGSVLGFRPVYVKPFKLVTFVKRVSLSLSKLDQKTSLWAFPQISDGRRCSIRPSGGVGKTRSSAFTADGPRDALSVESLLIAGKC